MNPEGTFSGNTVTVWWKAVPKASKYVVGIDQCNDFSNCLRVLEKQVTDTKLVETSEDYFSTCTIYTLEVKALNQNEVQLLKETALLQKLQSECDNVLAIILGVTLSLLTVVALLLMAGIFYYHRKHPLQRLRRARSRVYSKLYPRDKYVRPYGKEDFVHLFQPYFEGTNSEDSEKPIAFLAAEFSELEQLAVDTIQRRVTCASPPVNRRRNRYQDIVPFDATRVALHQPVCVEGENDMSDFINASCISDLTGHGGPKYIAAQGPGDETAPLFWEMIWQQNVRVIVMLTNLVEGFGFHSVKCSQYWPPIVGGTRRFHDMEVQLYDCQEAPDYLVRKLDVTHGQQNREIVHIQYTAWPDRSAPDEAAALLQLIDVTRVLSMQYNSRSQEDNLAPGPWLVHCSAGVGRTGTFIAVDELMRLASDPNKVEIDVFNVVYQLRKERRYMVQTLSQYTYVYRCVYEYLKRLKEQADNDSHVDVEIIHRGISISDRN